MSKFFLSVIAGLALLNPLASLPAAAQSPQHQQSDRAEQNRASNGAEARQRRENWRDESANARWDATQHNGYTQNKRWRAGPPPAAVARRGVELGYHPWARGQRLGYYRTRYEVVDYRTLNRRHPRRGYHWVRDERGDALLVAITTGLIADIIIHAN
jgi:Ni/Co efflux regulator RcnB